MSETVSKSQLAESLGVSRPRISQYVAAGLPVRADGRVDLDAAMAWLRENGREILNFADRGVKRALDAEEAEDAAADDAEPAGAGALDDEDGVLEYAEARALKETFLARRARLDYRRARNELVEVEAVAEVVSQEYATVRERLLSIPGKLASKLVGKDRAAIEALVLQEISEALEELHRAEDVVDEAIKRSESK